MKNDNFHTFFSLSWLQMFNLPALLQTKIHRLDRFHANGPCCKILTEKKTNQSTGICLRLGLPYNNNNLLLTKRESRTGEYWPEVVTVRTERSEVRTKTTEGQYSPVRPQQARLVSSLLYGTLFLIVKCTSGGLHSKNIRLLHPSLKFRKNFNLFSFCW